MDIYSYNRAGSILDELNTLRIEKDIWERAKGFATDVRVTDSITNEIISVRYIDFTELKNRTLTYIDSKIEELEKEFAEL